MKKPIRLPHSSFINGINIDKSFCDNVINHFKSNIHKAKPGRISNNKLSNIIEKDYKKSFDLDFIDDDLCDAFNPHLTKAIKEYEKKYKDVRNLATYSIIENPRIQYYKKGWGFKQWHCERSSHINRVFVWMVYLNDVKDGGTEFKYQKLKIPAKKGLFLMWPSDFTHTHRGIVSKTKEKYILTGWLGWKV
jgi:hypothetical protein